MRVLHRVDHCRPVVRLWHRPDAIVPRVREDVVHDEHGHVAANSVALLADLGQRLDHRGPQCGRKRIELNDIWPRREVGISPIGKNSTGNLDKRCRIVLQVFAGARHE